MDKQFDELSKSLATGINRREALRKFGLGLAGVLLASVGLSGKAGADPCPPGLTKCSHVGCVSLQSDSANCGRCGHICGGRKCCNGSCVPLYVICNYGP